MFDLLEDKIKHAGGLRSLIRWKLWGLGYVRCPMCKSMARVEHKAMCDCFHQDWIDRLRIKYGLDCSRCLHPWVQHRGARTGFFGRVLVGSCRYELGEMPNCDRCARAWAQIIPIKPFEMEEFHKDFFDHICVKPHHLDDPSQNDCDCYAS